MRFDLFAIFAVVLLLPLVASAQALGNLGGGDSSFTVSVSPQYPAPYSQAVLSFLSSSVDLANATLTVSVAGKKVHQGGVQPVAITLGKTGSVAQVAITITSGSATYRQTVVVQPQDVMLIAEPISSAPILYPGKPSVPLEGNVRVVAVANLRSATGKIFDPRTLSYAWSVDGARIANSSGIDKGTILVASPLQYRARNVSVAVMSQDGSVAGGASFSLTALDPFVRIYENDPLLGIRFERALSGAYTIKGAETTLFAAPFSLPITRGAPLLQWFLNGSLVQTGASVTLRPSGSGQGSASLSLVASSGDYTKATANLPLSFGTAEKFNLFGL